MMTPFLMKQPPSEQFHGYASEAFDFEPSIIQRGRPLFTDFVYGVQVCKAELLPKTLKSLFTFSIVMFTGSWDWERVPLSLTKTGT